MRHQTIKNRLRLSCLSRDTIQQVFEEMKGIPDESIMGGNGQQAWIKAVKHAFEKEKKNASTTPLISL